MTTKIGPSTALLGKFFKQVSEILDYDVDFTDWFSKRSDTPASYVVVVEAGITKITDSRVGFIVKVLLSGGTNGTRYKITVRMTSTAGLVKEVDFTVTVKDI